MASIVHDSVLFVGAIQIIGSTAETYNASAFSLVVVGNSYNLSILGARVLINKRGRKKEP